MSDAEPPAAPAQVRPNAASFVRRMVIRASLLGTFGAFLGPIVLTALDRKRQAPWELQAWLLGFCLLGGLITGVLVSLVGIVELRAAEWPASSRRDLAAAGLTLVSSVVFLFLACCQMAYTLALLLNGPKGAFGELDALLRDMRREPVAWTVLLSVTGAPFAPVSWTRLRGFKLGKQVVVSILGTCFAVAPMLALYPILLVATGEGPPGGNHNLGVFWFFGGLAVAEAVVVPLLWRATDALEQRVAHWLARRDAP